MELFRATIAENIAMGALLSNTLAKDVIEISKKRRKLRRLYIIAAVVLVMCLLIIFLINY